MAEVKKVHEQMYGGDDEDYGGQGSPHKSSWTEETVAAAASFAAMKAYENHVRNTGEQVPHAMMKEMLAGFAAAEVDKLFETHGLHFIDREHTKRRAIHQAHHLAEQQYGSDCTFRTAGGGGCQRNQERYGNDGYQRDQGQYGGGDYHQGQGQYRDSGYQQDQGQYGGSGYQQQTSGGNQFGGGNYPQQSGYTNNQFTGDDFGQGDEDEGRRKHHHQHHHREEDN